MALASPVMSAGGRSFDFLGTRWRCEESRPEIKVDLMERIVELINLGLEHFEDLENQESD